MTALGQLIESWAEDRSANVSLASYQRELSIWESMTGVRQVESALEVGSGVGLFSATLLETGRTSEVIGIDPVAGGEGSTVDELDQIKPELKQLYGDRLQIKKGWFPDDLPESGVDMIVFRKALHHIYEDHDSASQDVVEGLRAARERLNSGGWIYVVESVPPSPAVRSAIALYRRLNKVGAIDWEGKRRTAEWEELLSAAGFSEVRQTSLPFNFACGYPYVERASRSVSNKQLIAARR